MPFWNMSDWSKNLMVTIILMSVTALGTASGTAIVTSYTIGTSVKDFSNKLENVTKIALGNQEALIIQREKFEETQNSLRQLTSFTSANVNRLDREDDYLSEMIRDNSKNISTLVESMHMFERGLEIMKATRVTSDDIKGVQKSISDLCSRMTELKTITFNTREDISEIKQDIKNHEKNHERNER